MRPNRNTMMMGLLIAALSAILILSNLTGCSRSTKPKDVKYNLYVGATHLAANAEDSSYNRIYIYDADSLTLPDSIWQAHFTTQLVTPPDGRWLYVLDFNGDWEPMALLKIDPRTRQVMWSRSDINGGGGTGYLRFIDRGNLLLFGNTIVKPEDGSPVGHIVDRLRALSGPESGTKVAVTISTPPVGPANDSIIRVLDVTTGEVSGRYVAHLSSGVALEGLYTARLHPDGRRVLAIGVYGSVYNSWFVVGDVVTGQTLFEYQIDFPHGEIAINDDGSTAVFTDPGAAAFEGTGRPYAVDLRTYQILKPTTPRAADAHSPFISGGQVRFLPGGRRIVTAPMATIWHAGPLQVVDIARMTLEKTIWPIPSDSIAGEFIGGIAIGPRP